VCTIPRIAEFKYTTQVINNSRNPEWNEEFVVEDFTSQDELTFQVMDKDLGKEDDFLGRATLESYQILPEGFDGVLSLSEDGEAGTVKIRVEVSSVVSLPQQQVLMTMTASNVGHARLVQDEGILISFDAVVKQRIVAIAGPPLRIIDISLRITESVGGVTVLATISVPSGASAGLLLLTLTGACARKELTLAAGGQLESDMSRCINQIRHIKRVTDGRVSVDNVQLTTRLVKHTHPLPALEPSVQDLVKDLEMGIVFGGDAGSEYVAAHVHAKRRKEKLQRWESCMEQIRDGRLESLDWSSHLRKIVLDKLEEASQAHHETLVACRTTLELQEWNLDEEKSMRSMFELARKITERALFLHENAKEEQDLMNEASIRCRAQSQHELRVAMIESANANEEILQARRIEVNTRSALEEASHLRKSTADAVRITEAEEEAAAEHAELARSFHKSSHHKEKEQISLGILGEQIAVEGHRLRELTIDETAEAVRLRQLVHEETEVCQSVMYERDRLRRELVDVSRGIERWRR